MSKFRYLVTLSYHGISLFGSQKQPNQPTVFGNLELAFLKLFKQPIHCIPCGRTDTGVHAHVSYCHFDVSFSFDPDTVTGSLNKSLLSAGIMIRAIDRVPLDFHALSSAISRTYDYYFTFDSSLPNYLFHSVTVCFKQPLFIPATKQLQQLFVGQRNFSSLCNVSSDVQSYLRNVTYVDFTFQQYHSLMGTSIDIYKVRISANGFLYKMVRHIVGLLLHSMLNFTNMGRLNEYFLIHRPISYELAPVQGLHLAEVNYNNVTKVVTE